MNDGDTIAAIATPHGEGGIAVVRISGPRALAVGDRIFRGRTRLRDAPPRRMETGRVVDGRRSIDHVLAVAMPKPGSFTGEDVVEIQGHGGLVVARSVLEAAWRAGARPAEPGEFTRRAFLNGKIDLTQAEAVADLVRARTERAAESARRQLDGSLGSRIRATTASVLELVAEVEARIDFPEEDIPEKAAAVLAGEAAALEHALGDLESTARQGHYLRDGVRAVIAGRPNVGKSSLLNALAGRERAIVSEHPGTTRDTVEAEISVAGVAVVLVDTAGLREPEDPIEQLGVVRSETALGQADLVLHVIDACDPRSADRRGPAWDGNAVPRIVVVNKTDLCRLPDEAQLGGDRRVDVSAKTGQGLDELVASLANLIEGQAEGATPNTVTVNARHVHAIRDARESLARGRQELSTANLDRTAADWRLAWEQLATITGETTSEDILDLIFSKFCVGK